MVIIGNFELILSYSPTVNFNIFQQENKPTVHFVAELQGLLRCHFSHYLDSRTIPHQTSGATSRKKNRHWQRHDRKKYGCFR